jgi:hypothetical protein
MIGGGGQDPSGQEGVGRDGAPSLVIRGGGQDPPGQKGLEGDGALSGN